VRDKGKGGTAEKTDDMPTDYPPWSRGDIAGHGENDKSGGTNGGNNHHMFQVQQEQNDKNDYRGQKALVDVIEP